jgi:hypothetical protein
MFLKGSGSPKQELALSKICLYCIKNEKNARIKKQ